MKIIIGIIIGIAIVHTLVAISIQIIDDEDTVLLIGVGPVWAIIMPGLNKIIHQYRKRQK